MLTWHNGTIPDNQVWMKVGGDHGGDSFKMWIAPLNVDAPNSPYFTTTLLMCYDCRDSRENLDLLLSPIKLQIDALCKMRWRGKLVRVFVCGDYDFQTKFYGLSGAKGAHPCLWCCTTSAEMQQAPRDPAPQPRTLDSLKRDNDKFRAEGGDKTKAKFFNNVIERPIWDIEVEQVAPPYLHIVLGVVRKTIVAMEKECHKLDLEIAKNLKPGSNMKSFTEEYRCYVRKCNEIEETERQLRKYKQRQQKRKQAKQAILLAELKGKHRLEHRKGPVCFHLADLKVKHNIIEEGQHGGCYNGNHCDKFLETNVYTEICNGVLNKTKELTDCIELQNKAKDISSKFVTLSQRFHFVHTMISHANPVPSNQIMSIQHAITSYMNYARDTFPKESIIPKQHMLEHHCVSWIRKWGFGMGFHGEQGGERLHGECNKLKRDRFMGVKNKALQLELIVKTQHLKSCPDMVPSPFKKPRKQ